MEASLGKINQELSQKSNQTNPVQSKPNQTQPNSAMPMKNTNQPTNQSTNQPANQLNKEAKTKTISLAALFFERSSLILCFSVLPSPVVHDSGKNPLGCDRSRDTPSTLALSPFIPQRLLRRLRVFSGSSEGPPVAASFTVRVSALGVLRL